MSAGDGYLNQYKSVSQVLTRAYAMLEGADASGRTPFGNGGESHLTVRDVCVRFREQEADQPFTVAVIGEFNTGKSSLLNVLLDQVLTTSGAKGADGMLPTAMRATTATVTVVEHSPTIKMAAVLDDGSVVSLDASTMRALSADVSIWHKLLRGQDHGRIEDLQRRTREIRVGLPSRLLKAGIRIVDTPGLGSTNPKHSRITNAYLAKADAALFLVATDPPMGESEMFFLEQASRMLSKFLFVQTKADLGERMVEGEPLAQAREKEHKRGISEVLGHKRLEFYTVSAKAAGHGIRHRSEADIRSSGIRALEAGLDRFLGSHSAADRLRTWTSRLEACETVCRQSLEAEADTLRRRSADLAQVALTNDELEAWQATATAYGAMAYEAAKQATAEVLAKQQEIIAGLRQVAGAEAVKLRAHGSPSQSDVARAARVIIHQVRQALSTHLGLIIQHAIEQANGAACQALEHDLPPAARDLILNLDLSKVVAGDESRFGADDILRVTTKQVEKDGFFAGVARFFGWGGYEEVSETKVRGEVLISAAQEIAMESVMSTSRQLGDALMKIAATVTAEMDRAQAAARRQREQAERARSLDLGECRSRLNRIEQQIAGIDGVTQVRRRAVEAITALPVRAPDRP
jgi:GTP-binding protein EngB required for normal cell division